MRLELDQWDVTLNGTWQQDAANDNRYWHTFVAGDLTVYLTANQHPTLRHRVQVNSRRDNVDSLRINSAGIRNDCRQGWVQDASIARCQRWQINDGHAGIVDVQPTTDSRVLVDVWPCEGYDRLTIRSRAHGTPTSDTECTTEQPGEAVNVEAVEPTVDSYRRAFERLDTMLKAEATARDWCGEYEEFVEQFNAASSLVQLSGREQSYTGTVTVDFNFSAGRNDEARQGMNVVRDSVRELVERFDTLTNVAMTASHNIRPALT